MAKGMSIEHKCCSYRCEEIRYISKVAAQRRNGTRCLACGSNMEPTAKGYERLAQAHTAKQGG